MLMLTSYIEMLANAAQKKLKCCTVHASSATALTALYSTSFSLIESVITKGLTQDTCLATRQLSSHFSLQAFSQKVSKGKKMPPSFQVLSSTQVFAIKNAHQSQLCPTNNPNLPLVCMQLPSMVDEAPAAGTQLPSPLFNQLMKRDKDTNRYTRRGW